MNLTEGKEFLSQTIGVMNKTEEEEWLSQVILIACGDYKLTPLVRKYLKRMHELSEADMLMTASGSRTLSHYGVEGEELKQFEIKRAALFIDFDKYIHHKAKRCAIACHGLCLFWPIFADAQAEFEAHRQSLIEAGKIVMEKYPEMEEIILLYVELDRKKPHRPVWIYEINLNGEYKKIDPWTEPKMAHHKKN